MEYLLFSQLIAPLAMNIKEVYKNYTIVWSEVKTYKICEK